MKIKGRILIISFMLVTIVASIMLVMALRETGKIYVSEDDTSYINDNWKCTNQDEETNVNFPGVIKTKYKDTIYLENTLPAIETGYVIYIHTNYQKLKMFIGGDEVASTSMKESKLFKISNDNPWQAFYMSEEYSNKDIKIEITSYGSKQNIEIYNIIYGNEKAIKFNILSKNMLNIIMCCVLTILALQLFVSSLFLLFKKESSQMAKNFMILSMYLFFSDIWIYTDSGIQAVFHLGSMTYFLMNLFSYLSLAIPFIIIAIRRLKKGSEVFFIIAIAAILNIIYAIISMLTGDFKLATILSNSHVIYGAAIITLLVTSILEYFKYKNKELLSYIVSVLIISVCGMATMITFYGTSSSDNTNFFRIGVFIYSIILSTNAINVSIAINTNHKSIEKLRISEEKYRIASSHSDKYVIRYDVRKQTIYLDEETAKLFGTPLKLTNVPYHFLNYGILDPSSQEDFINFFECILGGIRQGAATIHVKNKDGEYRWLKMKYTNIFDVKNRPIQAIISFNDVTLLREKELAFEKWRQTYENMDLNKMNYYELNLTKNTFDKEDGYLFPKIAIEDTNNLNTILHYIATNNLAIVDEEKFLAFTNPARLIREFEKGIRSDSIECLYQDKGRRKWLMVSIQLINDPFSYDIKCYLMLQNIDTEKRAELLLRKQSTQDSLTRILNRGAFTQEVNNLFTNHDNNHVIVILDIDGFKKVNDTLGHSFGDEVLIDIANILKNILRKEDLLCRIGGDEYIMCIKNKKCGDKEIQDKLRLMCASIRNDYGLCVSISASFGVSEFPKDGTSFPRLYQAADRALNEAKRLGKNQIVYYYKELSKSRNMIDCVNTDLSESERNCTVIYLSDNKKNQSFVQSTLKDQYKVLLINNFDELSRLLKNSMNKKIILFIDAMFKDLTEYTYLELLRRDPFISNISVLIFIDEETIDLGEKLIELGASGLLSMPLNGEILKARTKDILLKAKFDTFKSQ